MNIGVIGAGVFGLASAIELRARGHAVTLFDQGTVPYEAASSTDVSKGIRRTWYAGDNETYVELVERAAEQWTRWEERSGAGFYHKVGGAYILDSMEPGSSMQASVDFLRSRGADISVLDAPEARDALPPVPPRRPRALRDRLLDRIHRERPRRLLHVPPGRGRGRSRSRGNAPSRAWRSGPGAST